MAVDQPGAIAAFVDRSRVFIDQNDHTFLVIHKTAGPGSALDIAHFFETDPNMASTHYVVDQAGQIAQCVLEVDGAAGNCCVETGYASFLNGFTDNVNWHSVSIEHVDPTPDNSTPLTAAQQAASFKLVKDICQRHNIPMRRAEDDGQGGIIGHCDIAPLSRARCPGNYPWTDLWNYLKGPTWMNTSQQKQAEDYWNSTTQQKASGNVGTGGIFPQGQTPSDSTGIALSWQQEYMLGHNYGPPISYEIQTVDFAGNAIVAQWFANGRCEHKAGSNTWFGNPA
jgi:N-acetyl-anhydromuramyl-L-alanine amidase AmpD